MPTSLLRISGSGSILRPGAAALLVALLCACGKTSTPAPDGGIPDAGAPDAGAPDAGSSDAGYALHYHRPAADYDGWQAEITAGGAQTTVSAAGTDGFGAVFPLPPAGPVTVALKKAGRVDTAGTLAVDRTGGAHDAWVISGMTKALTHTPPAVPDATHIALYYIRADQTYTGWGLHLWGDQVANTDWGGPLQPAGVDPDLGAGFLIERKPGAPAGNCTAGLICLIVHNGGSKDPGPDMTLDTAALGNLVFVTSGSTVITTVPSKPSVGNAHLLSRDTLAWKVADPNATVELRYSPTASLAISANDVTGGTAIALTPNPAGLTPAQKAFAPYLSTYRAFTIAAADLAKVKAALKGQLVAVARDSSGKMLAKSAVQTGWALDDLYAYAGTLGVAFNGQTPAFSLWAPTAQAVKLHVFDANKTELAGSPVAMTEGDAGVFSAAGQAAWYGGYYRYEVTVYHPSTDKIETVTVTDPYAVNCSTNGLYAQIIDLADPALQPAGWSSLAKPALGTATDIVLYESHIRDFSVADPTVPADRRGKYLGFVTPGGATQSDGLKHLQALAAAGLTHVHLLPAFDIASVDEDPARRVDLDDPFSKLCAKNSAVPASMCSQYGNQIVRDVLKGLPRGDSQTQQVIAGYLKELDSYNWGYDPFHYGAPEGSYASTADGPAKVVEFRQMVKGLSDIGLRVVMDVVYNHTNASGLAEKSVLDKIVPGYYHRLDPDSGSVYNSTCCANTATERVMMEKLMTDTLVRWAREYKIDGFRFDLMGHQPKAVMQRVLARLHALTPSADGVDGSKIYLYGEGWDFGEVGNNALFVNSSQVNLGGTGIGTFNDRIRDAVRGGGPFDSGGAIPQHQGFASGLFVDPNSSSGPAQGEKDTLGRRTDWIKIAMAGNLADFRLLTYGGAVSAGKDVDYNGQPAGYTQAPQETINYVSAHDNQILFDILQLKLPAGLAMASRVRDQNLALDTVMLGEGVPFIHMGDDLLRSKSGDGNSYNSGDWFNSIDWSGQSTAWATGLPPTGDNYNNWFILVNASKDPTTTPGPADIAAARDHFRELLRIRRSTKLLRLDAKADVMKRVDFLNAGPGQVPGVIVMSVTDGTCAGADLDPARDAVMVIINANPNALDIQMPGATGFTLHSVQQASADPVLRYATFSGITFSVPGRTTAVFEQLQTGAQGAGLACNTR